ncbi:MAG: BrxA/BrxB family bacilliredoxin [Bacteroidia bacterium]|nr:BrxA/BrxB family bacilliredoxin [Bacteroidia bacterium]
MSRYPLELVMPMAQELTSNGFRSLTSPEEVDTLMHDQKGTALVVVNSVCGCAAGAARPGVLLAMEHAVKKPDQAVTVFAGVDGDATQKMRSYFLPYPPSSPSIALFKDGQLVHMVERHHIEGRSAQMIAQNLIAAFDEYC